MILACVMMLSMAVHAQWRVGVTGGTDYNLYTMDMQYESDWKTEGRWGATVGITGQYNVTHEFLSAEKCDANASKTIKNVIKTVMGEF